MPLRIDFMYSKTTGRGKEAEEALAQAIEATEADAEIVYTEVTDSEDAKTRKFLGSPSIRVNGVDVEYGEREPDEYQAGTRYYNSPAGWKPFPHAKMIANRIIEVQQRLEAAGYATQREEGVECCHSRQSKFWVRDPDGNQWEIYLLDDDDEHCERAGEPKHVVNLQATTTAGPALPAVSDAAPATAAVWTHRLDEDFVVELADNSLDEIQLQGTFNSRRFADMHLAILRRTLAALRPGGKLLVHALATGRAPSAVPKLPGPAAVVTHVPVDEQLVNAAEAAGFTAIELLRFSDAPCFQCDGVAMRELQFVALKPDARSDEGEAVVVYRGPLAQVVDEGGRVYRRGRRVPVDSATRDRLRHGSAQGSFAFPEDPPSSPPPAQG